MSFRTLRPRFRYAILVSIAALAVAPAGAQAFSKAIWGSVYRNGVNQFPLYKRMGVTTYEANLDWSQIAVKRPRDPASPRDPAYHWPAAVGQAIGQAKKFHMQVVLQISYTPGWANGGRAPQWIPNHASDYATFAAAASREYPSVHLWMIWGEPDNRFNFQPLHATVGFDFGKPLSAEQKLAPRNYAILLDAAYGALKSVSRRNLVIGSNTWTFGDIDTYDWIANLRLPNGKAPRMDMYGHNPFSERDPNFAQQQTAEGAYDFSDLHRLGYLIDRNLKPGLPFFLSEFTIPTHPDQEFGYWVDPPVAAQWIRDALRLSRRWHRIYALGWIHVYDDPSSAGGLLNANGSPKPTYYAWRNF